jgi:aspartyl-tRNA(Asn)/glutamyl-tRNA(Gln) amidotransferase subunit B
MRTKEDAADYRYFPDPDLPPLVIARDWVEQVKATMTEPPRAMATRWINQHSLPEYDATALTRSPATARYFEAMVAAGAPAKLASNWIMGEVTRRLNESERSIEDVPVTAGTLADVIQRVQDGTLSNSTAKLVLDAIWGGDTNGVDAIIEAKGLKQMNDTGELEKIVDQVLAANPKNVAEYKAGNTKALNALVGQIMKGSQGKANPQQVNDLLHQKLG